MRFVDSVKFNGPFITFSCSAKFCFLSALNLVRSHLNVARTGGLNITVVGSVIHQEVPTC
jgi:hypothetical protein